MRDRLARAFVVLGTVLLCAGIALAPTTLYADEPPDDDSIPKPGCNSGRCNDGCHGRNILACGNKQTNSGCQNADDCDDCRCDKRGHDTIDDVLKLYCECTHKKYVSE